MPTHLLKMLITTSYHRLGTHHLDFLLVRLLLLVRHPPKGSWFRLNLSSEKVCAELKPYIKDLNSKSRA